MKIVRVGLGRRSYNIHIGKGIIEKLRPDKALGLEKRPVFVLSNRKIWSLHGASVIKFLRPISSSVLVHKVSDSEKAKSFPVYTKTIGKLSDFAKKTKPLLVSFGGGVIGDLGGFVASTYRRGVPYLNIPTTLLAQVDSAIGGKVALDINKAKNIVGNFYQPLQVLCELRFLKTLPEKELRNGLAEVVKYGIIKDGKLFSFLEKNLEKIIKRDWDSLEYIVARSCAIKARIVEKDEYDTRDIRAVLNFGHTIGHAVEAACHYSNTLPHGRAVAIGMIMAISISMELGLIRKVDCERMQALLGRIDKGARKLKRIRSGDILEALSYDKKFVSGKNKFILPRKIGSVKIVEGIPRNIIKRVVGKITEV